MDIGNVGNLAFNTTAARSTAGGNKLGQEEFLKLLVTQLTHQDPLNPQEDKEFIAQMAQFSSLENMLAMSKTMERVYAASLLGAHVDAVTVVGGEQVVASGPVTQVNYTSEGVKLTVGGQQVDLTSVSQVRTS